MIYVKKSTYALCLILFATIPFVVKFIWFDFDAVYSDNAYVFFIKCFGGIPQQMVTSITLFAEIIPPVLLLYFFSNIVYQDVSSVYQFMRYSKKQNWLSKKFIQLFFFVFLTYLFLYFFVFLIAKANHLAFPPLNDESWNAMIFMFLCNVLTLFFLSFLQNMLSIRFGSQLSFLFTMALYLVPLIFVALFYHKNPVVDRILSILISSNQMYIWHIDAMQNPAMPNDPLSNFSIGFSLLLLITYLLLAYWTSRTILLRTGFLEIIKEDE